MIEFNEVRVHYDGRTSTLREPAKILINPDCITSVRPERTEFSSSLVVIGSTIEYFGNSGYHTRTSFVAESYDEVKLKLGLPLEPKPRINHEKK